MPIQPQNPAQPLAGKKLKAFLTGAVIAASALAGGLAVVLWNRQALSRLRQQAEPGDRPSTQQDGEEE
jgi:hypothetical protein